jgi:tetratricopeptide (TPR) repeat protein
MRIHRISLCLIWILGFAVLGVSVSAEPSEAETQLVNRLKGASLPEKEMDIAYGALAIAQTVYPEIDMAVYLKQVDQLAQDIRSQLPAGLPPEKILKGINKYLYQTRNVNTEGMGVEVDKFDDFLLNKVLDAMKGNCLGLSTLYWSLAERLDVPLQAIVIPRHVFLNYQDKNIEATDRGLHLDRAEYLKKTGELIARTYPKYSVGPEIKFRPLNKKQFFGLIIYNRGVIRQKMQLRESALQDYTNALLLDPENLEAYKSRGALYLNRQEFDRALSDLQRAERLEPGCPMTYYNLGAAYFSLKELSESLHYLDKALELAPDYAEAYNNRGAIYTMKKNYSLALADFNKALELNNQYTDAYFNRGLVWSGLYREKKDAELLDRAVEDYSRAITLNPKYADAYNNRGIAYCQQKKFEFAVNDFLEALALDPAQAEAARNLGMAYFEIGQYEAVIRYLRQYLKQSPADEARIKEVETAIKEAQRRMEK